MPTVSSTGTLPGLLTSWQCVQDALHAHRPAATAALDMAGLAVYHHCAHLAFAQPADARRTRELLGQLIPAGEQLLYGPWTAAQLEQACTLAWLHGHQAVGSAGADMATLLGYLDELLPQHALLLLERPDASGRRVFTQVLRYLSLRRPAARIVRRLQALVAYRAARPVLPASPVAEPWPLGLPDGLAGELLQLLRIPPHLPTGPTLIRYVRAGIVRLLATRGEVDFSARHYSVFPYQVAGPAAEATFSAALTWGRGDLAQALVLYEAHALLHDNELATIAELVGLNTLLRTSALATEVSDARFCRGAAGVAHLYHRLYQASGQAAYHQGRQFWLGQTQQWLPQELVAPGPRPGELLHGLAGLGLVLLTAATNIDFGWDAIVL